MTVKSPQLTKDSLYKMYWKEGKNLRVLGEEIGCDAVTVARYMKKFGVRIRGLSEAKTRKYLSEESRKRISEAQRGKHPSEESRKKMSDAHRNPSEETRRKMSEANKGEKNGFYGKHHSEETLKKLSDASKGRHHSKETRKKISEAGKGEKNPFYGKHHTEESRKKMSNSTKGEKHPFYGKHPSKETLKKLSEAKRGEKHPFYGKHRSEEVRKKISNSTKGEKCIHWEGGISYEPYCPRFNFRLKEKIREKYGRACFLCGKTETENGKRLDVHHVDGDKMQGCSGKELLLVPLCVSCHAKIKFDKNKKLNDELLEKLGAGGNGKTPKYIHTASLNDYTTTDIPITPI